MTRTILCLCLPAAIAMMVGCSASANVTHDESPPPRAAAPVDDGRSATDLRRENERLRERLGTLEEENKAWLANIDRRKADIKDLERRRDDLEKDRDRYKKLAKKADD